MKFLPILAVCLITCPSLQSLALDRYVSLQGNHVAPFTSWADAATNIQDAVDAAVAGDVVWVTNGIYSTGSRAVDGGTRNRVVVDKAITLRSVDGPSVTVIEGAWDPVNTNGPASVRGAWLRKGALLSGFTVQNSSARYDGGGVYCASPEAMLEHCVVTNNHAAEWGGGVYGGLVESCLITHNGAGEYGGGVAQSTVIGSTLRGNRALLGGGGRKAHFERSLLIGNSASTGGGAYESTLHGCVVSANTAEFDAAGTWSCTLNNCTVTWNECFYSSPQAAVVRGTLTNCVVFGNIPDDHPGWGPSLPQFYHTCTAPLPSTGFGNIDLDPRLARDGYHLQPDSPCIGAGMTGASVKADIDGQRWTDPPSMGCDEPGPEPLIFTKPRVVPRVFDGKAVVSVSAAGADGNCYWSKDGELLGVTATSSESSTAQLLLADFGPDHAGVYQAVLSNSFGMVTSEVASITVHCVNASSASPEAPFTSWESAASTVQEAIDVAQEGAVVLVTDGLYSTGGKVMFGDLTNRIAVDKPITVLSANGAGETIIEGRWHDSTSYGATAVRCAWLANDAILGGFTLRQGATRASGDPISDSNGGGVWCSSSRAEVVACVVTHNAAVNLGGGAYSGTLRNCLVNSNSVFGHGGGLAGSYAERCRVVGNTAQREGGGIYGGRLLNCVVSGNTAGAQSGVVSTLGSGGGVSGGRATGTLIASNSATWWCGGAYRSSLQNCTVIHNTALSATGAGAYRSTLINSICYYNGSTFASSQGNHFSSQLSFTCSTPLATGEGNIDSDPQFVSGHYLSENSPCRGAGSPTRVGGVDLDGQPWANPPSMGCDEWHPEPLFVRSPTTQARGAPGTVLLSGARLAGKAPFGFHWLKGGLKVEDGPIFDNSGTGELTVSLSDPDVQGSYALVASNAFGMATSAVAQLAIHYVSAAGVDPRPPYSTWHHAATEIQDAIDVAQPGRVVLVTNGIYATGGKAISNGVTNRIALDKAVAVVSANGPHVTTIRGAHDPGTPTGIGDAAVRCAWLGEGASLSGFTLSGGATTTYGIDSDGGGVFCSSLHSYVVNSIITSNSAFLGGGVYQGTLQNCAIHGNSADMGGGAYFSDLEHCVVSANTAKIRGGLYLGNINNCIVYFNEPRDSSPGNFSYSCAPFLEPGSGNISEDPRLTGPYRLGADSPCRGAGSPEFSVGADLDGDLWLDPPSMGCDEIYESAFVGPLLASIIPRYAEVVAGVAVPFKGMVAGDASRLDWSFGDGAVVTNVSYITSHAYAEPGDYAISLTAFNADNPLGVTTNLSVQVVPVAPPILINPEMFGADNFRAEFTSQPGVTYEVEWTTNLVPPVVWTRKSTVRATGYSATIVDFNANLPERFYRVRVP